ncbi:sugar transferase [Knoellia koreensis]|uniref:Sugar transferase n=1 Tax=Knoellia koreensis TaxID=2730921 RepID=A0A849H7Q4_9MICO|nr:sugar transferase [Knoellia sp. DB2414S]NNM45776.1 sugar transferase [Knoellia sp. DB2414S]
MGSGDLDAKRVFDLVVSLALLAGLWPLLVVIAVAVLVDSRGPVMFRQERVGLGGQLFRIHKFRTMTVTHDGVLVSATGDRRVTRVGRVLRRTKLDELPQLLDVVAGNMSLVGPRPEVPSYAALWPAESYSLIVSVRPGVTDPASIRFRNEADLLAAVDDPDAYYRDVILPEKARIYVDYVRRRTFTGDLGILARTVKSVLRH